MAAPLSAIGTITVKWDPESLAAINALAVQLEKLREDRDTDD